MTDTQSISVHAPQFIVAEFLMFDKFGQPQFKPVFASMSLNECIGYVGRNKPTRFVVQMSLVLDSRGIPDAPKMALVPHGVNG